MERRNPANDSPRPATSPQSSTSTPTPSCAPCANYGMKGSLEFRRGRGITVAGTPERGAVIAQAKALVEFARRHGYRVDELVEIIETVG